METENCALCGAPIEYLTGFRELSCESCGRREPAHAVCSKGHYLCDSCHGAGIRKTIMDMALMTLEKDPFKTAEAMFSQPGLPMLGCEHACIAAGAFLSAVKNDGRIKISNKQLHEAFQRLSRQAAGGYCGLTGVCGILPALGACVSILYGSRCGKDIEQRLTMETVTRVSSEIVKLTGPSCCKAYALAGLGVAVDFLKDASGVALPVQNRIVKCLWSARHPHGCRLDKCPYFDLASYRPAAGNPPHSVGLC